MSAKAPNINEASGEMLFIIYYTNIVALSCPDGVHVYTTKH